MIGVTQEVVDAGFPDPKAPALSTTTGWPEPSAFIQWKGTDVCMDFHCECGAFCHFDGDFAYTVKCPHCSTVWEMPSTVYPRKAAGHVIPYFIEMAQVMEPDETLAPTS